METSEVRELEPAAEWRAVDVADQDSWTLRLTGADHATRTTRSPNARSQPSTSTATIRHAPEPPAMRAIASG